jgi:YidC/Oxa1 family membrane protein insertase
MPIIFANVIQDAFGPLITVFEAILVFIHDQILHGSWGFSIIGLTIVVRAILVPLTLKQSRSMLKLQALAPEMQALRERYKDDKQRLNQEMMAFYKEHKVNPLGSCLPVLLQLPFFLSLFYMLRHDLRNDICHQVAKPCGKVAGHWDTSFFFIKDITDKATGTALIVLIVLYVGSQLVSGLITTFTADRSQRIMMLALPFVFVTFIINFQAGLILYWITTNLWTIGQGLVVKRVIPAPVLATPEGAAAIAAAKPPPRPPKKKKKRR